MDLRRVMAGLNTGDEAGHVRLGSEELLAKDSCHSMLLDVD